MSQVNKLKMVVKCLIVKWFFKSLIFSMATLSLNCYSGIWLLQEPGTLHRDPGNQHHPTQAYRVTRSCTLESSLKSEEWRAQATSFILVGSELVCSHFLGMPFIFYRPSDLYSRTWIYQRPGTESSGQCGLQIEKQWGRPGSDWGQAVN